MLPRRQMRAVVAAGFGGFLAHGGGALDQYALQAAGAAKGAAKARVAALGGLEHGVLAIGGCAAAIAVLVSGRPAGGRLHSSLGGHPCPGVPDRFLGRASAR